jgi:bacterioferritin-associated ferredoxin
VLDSEVAAAIASGATTVNDVKRWTRAGMGACQGIYCVPAIAMMVGEATGTPVEHIAPMTARAPARPIRLAALADLAVAGRDDNRFEMTREDGS